MLTELAGIVHAGSDLDELLPAMARRMRTLLGGAEIGVAVDGVVGGSGKRASALTEAQTALGQGPVPEALRDGRQVVNVGPSDRERRWRAVQRLSAVAGYASLHAIPLQWHGETLGVAGIYFVAEHDLSEGELAEARTFASSASVILMQARSLREWRTRAGQLQEALTSRIVIEQAKGVLAERHGLSMEDAFSLLRHHARRRQARLHAFAEAVVTGTITSEDLGIAS